MNYHKFVIIHTRYIHGQCLCKLGWTILIFKSVCCLVNISPCIRCMCVFFLRIVTDTNMIHKYSTSGGAIQTIIVFSKNVF